MCGIVGISAESNVASEIYESLLMLQHRGQDAAGMVVCDDEGRLNSMPNVAPQSFEDVMMFNVCPDTGKLIYPK